MSWRENLGTVWSPMACIERRKILTFTKIISFGFTLLVEQVALQQPLQVSLSYLPFRSLSLQNSILYLSFLQNNKVQRTKRLIHYLHRRHTIGAQTQAQTPSSVKLLAALNQNNFPKSKQLCFLLWVPQPRGRRQRFFSLLITTNPFPKKWQASHWTNWRGLFGPQLVNCI